MTIAEENADMKMATRWPAALAMSGALVLALVSTFAWRLRLQEKAIERETLRKRQENAASLVARESERALQQAIADERTSLMIEWDERGLHRTSGVPLLWSTAPAPPDTPESSLPTGERLEYSEGRLEQAIVVYRGFLPSGDAAVRAGALVAIARCQRKLGRHADAVETYRQLAMMGEVRVAGAPAVLVGRREQLALVEAHGDPAEAARLRAGLEALLERGGLALDRSTFEFYAQGFPAVARWGVWAEAAEELFRRASAAASGATLLTVAGRTFVAEWSRDESRGSGRLTDFESVSDRVTRTLAASTFGWRLIDSEQTIAGRDGVRGTSMARKPGETGLPWTVEVTLQPQRAPWAEGLAATGIGVLGLAVLATLYLAYRAIRRELRVAGMQSEFVAAVSHEFRTPITALTHLTDLLESAEPPADRRPVYYQALARETRRLREMVENLLDFGRLEAGRYRYKPEAVDPTDLVRSVVAEFSSHSGAAGRDIRFEAAGDSVLLDLDREAMRRAVWNLLDNAVKYSADGTSVTIHVVSEGGRTAISVSDRGCGIERQDRTRIFQKFVRGTTAEAGAVKGTGIGLAMVQAIVGAHGGRIELESRVGEGSRFTILLPTERKQRDSNPDRGRRAKHRVGA
jgi:signal transduction histidine kinase